MPADEATGSLDALVLLPVFNDWKACLIVLRGLDEVAAKQHLRLQILIVDDGSTNRLDAELDQDEFSHLEGIDVLWLRRNLGHQRAIAVGLCYAESQLACDVTVVMDSDGEDDPNDVPRLLQKCREESGRRVVFAQRAKRSECWAFRIFYQCYKSLYRILTSQSVSMGNFSVVPRDCLRRLVVAPELWSHYAAAVISSKTPYCTVPTKRAKRVDGESRMNFVGLVVHGLSAISVFSDIVGVRVLIATLILILGDLIGMLAIACLRLFTDLAIPGWASHVTGILLVILVQAVMFTVMFSFTILSGRKEATIVPARDYVHYLDHKTTLWENLQHGDARIFRLGA